MVQLNKCTLVHKKGSKELKLKTVLQKINSIQPAILKLRIGHNNEATIKISWELCILIVIYRMHIMIMTY